jgi:tetratricopeptide (TPR) repeat protein
MKVILSLIFLAAPSFFGYGQAGSEVVIQQARKYMEEKKYLEAWEVLDGFNRNNQSSDALRLQAYIGGQLTYMNSTDSLYKIVLNLLPGSAEVAMEYGRFLFETGKFRESFPFLQKAESNPSFHAEAALKLSYIDFWLGRIPQARNRIKALLEQYPDFVGALELQEALKEATAPHFITDLYHQTDDQPYQQTRVNINAWMYRNRWLTPELNLNIGLLDPKIFEKVQTLEAWVGNTVLLGSANTSLSIKAGGFFHSMQDITGLYQVTLSQKTGGGLKFSADAYKKPYQYTINSAPLALIQEGYSFSLALDNKKKWLGKAVWENQRFPDDNRITNAYLWAMAPLLKKEHILLRLGYGFSFANSDTNRFVPIPKQEVTPGAELQGWFNPYFTPINQKVHMILASANIDLSAKVRADLNVSYGFNAVNTTKYFIEQGAGTTPFSGDVDVAYNPMELTFLLNWKVSDKLQIAPYYAYQHLFFFTSNRFGLKFIR